MRSFCSIYRASYALAWVFWPPQVVTSVLLYEFVSAASALSHLLGIPPHSFLLVELRSAFRSSSLFFSTGSPRSNYFTFSNSVYFIINWLLACASVLNLFYSVFHIVNSVRDYSLRFWGSAFFYIAVSISGTTFFIYHFWSASAGTSHFSPISMWPVFPSRQSLALFPSWSRLLSWSHPGYACVRWCPVCGCAIGRAATWWLGRWNYLVRGGVWRDQAADFQDNQEQHEADYGDQRLEGRDPQHITGRQEAVQRVDQPVCEQVPVQRRQSSREAHP